MRVIVICIQWKPPGKSKTKESIIDRLNKLRRIYSNDFIGSVRVAVPRTTSISAIYSIYAVLGRVFPSQYVHLCVLPQNDFTSSKLTRSELLFQWPNDIIQFWEPDLVSIYNELDGLLDDSDQDNWRMNDLELNFTRKCTIDEETLDKASKKQLFAFGGSFDGLHVGHLMALHTLLTLVVRSAGSKVIVFGVSDDTVVTGKSRGEWAQDFSLRLDSLDRAMNCLLKCYGFVRSKRSHPPDQSIGMSENAILSRHVQDIQAQYDVRLVQEWQGEGDKQVQVVFTVLDSGGIGVAAYKDIEVLVVSPETIKGGKYVNVARKASGLSELMLCICPLVLRPADENIEVLNGSIENKISSSDERELLAAVLYEPEMHLWLLSELRCNNELSKPPLPLSLPLPHRDRIITFVRYVILPLYNNELLEMDHLDIQNSSGATTIRSSACKPLNVEHVGRLLKNALRRLDAEQYRRALEYVRGQIN